MGLAEWFVRNIGHPLWLTYKGETAILSWQRQLEELFTATRADLEAWQLQKLQRLLHHAGTTSPYYRTLFSERSFDSSRIDSLSRLRDLPFMTKEILNHQMEQVLSHSFKRTQLTEASTGGSSGIPLTFYRDRNVTTVRRAQDYFFNAAIGIYPGTKRAWVWGSPIDAFSLAKLKARIANFLTERAVYFYSFDADRAQVQQFMEQLRRHHPEVVIAYPNMLSEIAEVAMSRSDEIPQIDKVVVTAEPLYDWHRALFKQVFGADTYERYGSREIGTVAAQLTPDSAMVICEPSYIIEVVDQQRKPVEAGMLGELVVTDLFNLAMPLIRYRTGDMVRVGTPQQGSGTCWRPLLEVGGRVVDMVQRRDGMRIAGEALIMALRTAGVRSKVQIVQESATRLKLLHLQNDAPESGAMENFKRSVADLLRGEVEITLEAVPELPHDKSGKYRYVTSRCGNAAGA